MSSQIDSRELLLKASEQAEGAEIYQMRSLQTPAIFTGGVLESVRSVETAGRALRVIKDGRLGFSTTTDLSDGSTLVSNALEAAQFGDPVSFQFPSPQPVPSVQCFDDEVAQLDERDLIALGKEVIARIASSEPQVLINVTVRKTLEQVRLLNSSGLDVDNERTTLQLWVGVERAREGDIFSTFGRTISRRRQDVDGLAVAERIIERIKWAERITKVEKPALPVVFQDTGLLTLILPLALGLNGRNVYLGMSPLSEKLEQQVLDERVTLVDDGQLDFAPRATPFDDEGMPTTTKPLIEQGHLRQFIYDLKTAAQAETKSTGNGFKTAALFDRGGNVPPNVNPSSWLIHPGEQSLDQILQGFDEALLVESVLGLGQGNVVAGEFSNAISEGFLVRRGEVVGRVKNTMIAGNVYDLLHNHLIALSDQPKWIDGWLRAPAIALEGVGVVGRG